MRTRRTFGALTAAALLVLTGCSSNQREEGGFVFSSPGGLTDLSYDVGERGRVGDFGGPDLSGDGTIMVTDFLGTVVVVNLWGSWCGPCIEELPDLEVAWELTKDEDVQFLGINVRETRSAGADFAEAYEIPYPSIWDQGMVTLTALGGIPTNAIPSTLILDREGQVARVFLGKVEAQTLTDGIRAVLSETNVSPSDSAEATTSGGGR